MPKTPNQAEGQAKPDWAERIDAAVKAGEKAAYADLEEGLLHLLNENKVLKDFSREAQKLIGRMVMARRGKNTTLLLAELDAFIKERVIVQEVPKKPTLN
jgi:hypothetical protein